MTQMQFVGASLWVQLVKNLLASAGGCRRCRFDSWVGKIPWSRKWQPTPVFLPGKFHGQRSLAGYSLWGHKESDMAECTHTHTHTHTHRVCEPMALPSHVHTHTHTVSEPMALPSHAHTHTSHTCCGPAALLGLCRCLRLFSRCAEWELLSFRGVGFSLQSTGSRTQALKLIAHGLSCSKACGIFPDQGSNPCPQQWFK